MMREEGKTTFSSWRNGLAWSSLPRRRPVGLRSAQRKTTGEIFKCCLDFVDARSLLGLKSKHASQHLFDLLSLTGSWLLSSVRGKTEVWNCFRLVVLLVKTRSCQKKVKDKDHKSTIKHVFIMSVMSSSIYTRWLASCCFNYDVSALY